MKTEPGLHYVAASRGIPSGGLDPMLSGLILRQMDWSLEEKLVYDAVADGYTDLDSLPLATGCGLSSVKKALRSLVSKGFVLEAVSVD